MLLAAGTQRGHLILWDFRTGALTATRPAAHPAAIDTLGFGTLNGRPTIATGGADDTLRLWTISLDELFRIEIGKPIKAVSWTGPNRLAIGGYAGVLALRFD